MSILQLTEYCRLYPVRVGVPPHHACHMSIKDAMVSQMKSILRQITATESTLYHVRTTVFSNAIQPKIYLIVSRHHCQQFHQHDQSLRRYLRNLFKQFITKSPMNESTYEPSNAHFN